MSTRRRSNRSLGALRAAFRSFTLDCCHHVAIAGEEAHMALQSGIEIARVSSALDTVARRRVLLLSLLSGVAGRGRFRREVLPRWRGRKEGCADGCHQCDPRDKLPPPTLRDFTSSAWPKTRVDKTSLNGKCRRSRDVRRRRLAGRTTPSWSWTRDVDLVKSLPEHLLASDIDRVIFVDARKAPTPRQESGVGLHQKPSS